LAPYPDKFKIIQCVRLLTFSLLATICTIIGFREVKLLH